MLDTYDESYPYVSLQLPPRLGNYSIWNLPVHILKGVRDGDAVRIKVSDNLADTVWRSAPIVLHKVRKSIENVTVDKDGVVKGVGAGKYAEITATGKESGKKATCVVRVKIPETTTTTTTTKAAEDQETDEN